MNQDLRTGNFTSSEIVALTKDNKAKNGFGEKALTYIDECNMERRLGRSIEKDENARSLSWGKLLEIRVFKELLGTEYISSGDATFIHPKINYWAGTPDGEKEAKGKIEFDIKCPTSLKSFCQLVQPLYDGLFGMGAMKAVIENSKDGEKYYWQLVSNCCIRGARFAELIVYCPYKSELEAIRELARNYDGADQHKFSWLNNASDDELPHLPDGGYYKNLNIIKFYPPQADREFLKARVLKAGELLVPLHNKQLQPA